MRHPTGPACSRSERRQDRSRAVFDARSSRGPAGPFDHASVHEPAKDGGCPWCAHAEQAPDVPVRDPTVLRQVRNDGGFDLAGGVAPMRHGCARSGAELAGLSEALAEVLGVGHGLGDGGPIVARSHRRRGIECWRRGDLRGADGYCDVRGECDACECALHARSGRSSSGRRAEGTACRSKEGFRRHSLAWARFEVGTLTDRLPAALRRAALRTVARAHRARGGAGTRGRLACAPC